MYIWRHMAQFIFLLCFTGSSQASVFNSSVFWAAVLRISSWPRSTNLWRRSACCSSPSTSCSFPSRAFQVLQPWPSLLKSTPAWSEGQEQESVLLLAKLVQPLVPWRTSSWFLNDFVFGEIHSNSNEFDKLLPWQCLTQDVKFRNYKRFFSRHSHVLILAFTNLDSVTKIRC